MTRKSWVCLVFVWWLGAAQAATVELTLKGNVGAASDVDLVSDGVRYDWWRVDLGLVGGSVTLSQGDVVNGTIVFDQPVVLRPADLGTLFKFSLSGPAFPSGNAGTSGTMSFYRGGIAVATVDEQFDTSGTAALSFGQFLDSPNNELAFDSIRGSFVVDLLAGPAVVTVGSLEFMALSTAPPVPEPETWALLLAGMTLVGGALRKRSKATAGETATPRR